MIETPEQLAAREAQELKEFQGLTNYADRYAYFNAHPSLAKVYCVGNFSVNPVEKPAAASESPNPA